MLDGHQVPHFHNWIKCHLGFLFSAEQMFWYTLKGCLFRGQNMAIVPLECPLDGQTRVVCPLNCPGWWSGVKCKLVGHFRVLLQQIKCDECDVKKHSRVITVAGIRWSIRVPFYGAIVLTHLWLTLQTARVSHCWMWTYVIYKLEGFVSIFSAMILFRELRTVSFVAHALLKQFKLSTHSLQRLWILFLAEFLFPLQILVRDFTQLCVRFQFFFAAFQERMRSWLCLDLKGWWDCTEATAVSFSAPTPGTTPATLSHLHMCNTFPVKPKE